MLPGFGIALISVLAVSCAGGDVSPPVVVSHDSSTIPVTARGRSTSPGVIGIHLTNMSDRSLHVVDVRPIADAGLSASYLGACRPGCPGTLHSRPHLVDRWRKRGAATFTLEPDTTDWGVMFSLDATPERIADRGCLYLWTASLILEDGSEIEVEPLPRFFGAISPPGRSGSCGRMP